MNISSKFLVGLNAIVIVGVLALLGIMGLFSQSGIEKLSLPEIFQQSPPQYSINRTVAQTQLVCDEKALVNLEVTRTGQDTSLPLDVMFVIDKSGSMDDLAGLEPITSARQAAKIFIDQLNPTIDRVALTTFNTTESLDSSFTNNFSQVKGLIDAISILDNNDLQAQTNVQAGIKRAREHLKSNMRPNSKSIMVFLSDGIPNRYTNSNNTIIECEGWPTQATACTNAALAEAQIAKQDGIEIYAIGVGFEDFNIPHPGSGTFALQLSQSIASSPSHFYEAPTPQDLASIYNTISEQTKSSIKLTRLTEVVNQNFQIFPSSINPQPTSLTGNTIVWEWTTQATGQKRSFTYQIGRKNSYGTFPVVTNDSNLLYIDDKDQETIIAVPNTHQLTLIQGPACSPTATPSATAIPSPTPSSTPLAGICEIFFTLGPLEEPLACLDLTSSGFADRGQTVTFTCKATGTGAAYANFRMLANGNPIASATPVALTNNQAQWPFTIPTNAPQGTYIAQCQICKDDNSCTAWGPTQ